MPYIITAAVAVALFIIYLIFRDTMNVFQKVWRIYWVTRDNGQFGAPWIGKAWMKFDSPPFWYGRGMQFRFRTWTFQVGWLQGQKHSLEEQISNIGWLPDVDPEVFRKIPGTWGEDVYPSITQG